MFLAQSSPRVEFENVSGKQLHLAHQLQIELQLEKLELLREEELVRKDDEVFRVERRGDFFHLELLEVHVEEVDIFRVDLHIAHSVLNFEGRAKGSLVSALEINDYGHSLLLIVD